MPSTPARSTTWSRTSRKRPAACATYQLVCWLQQLRDGECARPRTGTAARRSASWRGIRCYLHLAARRDHNVLSFDAQDALAEQWQRRRRGPLDARLLPPRARRFPRRHRASSNPPRRSRARCSRSSATGGRASRTPTSACSATARISARRSRSMRSPNLVLNLFEFVARHGIRPSLEAEQQLDAPGLPRIREHGAAWPALARISRPAACSTGRPLDA